MKRRPFMYEGVTYDLSHLDSFYWNYTAKADENRQEQVYKFQVTCSMHCFTRAPLPGENIEASLWYKGQKEQRVFCFDRFKLSLKLPTIIKDMGNRTCWHTHHGNFFTIDITTQEGKNIEYEVYFDITRASRKGWLNLIIQTAYERTEAYMTMQPRKRKIRLDVIAYKRRLGKNIRPGR